MPSAAVMRVLLRELTTRERLARTPEPDLIMDDPDKVAAYTRAGRVDGVMAPVYLFHCANISDVLRPGDRALDLACGPATQLAQVAAVHDQVSFTGLDLSAEMLAKAGKHIADQGLQNVQLQQGSIEDLSAFESHSMDAIFSTMALHHLADFNALQATFGEIARVLKPSGGLYLVDFGRLRAEKSVAYFANQYADRQPRLFTLDYLYSLRAAFSVRDFRRAGLVLQDRARLFTTFLMPYMVAFKSAARSQYDGVTAEKIHAMRETLPAHHRIDLKDLALFFRLGGLRSQYL